MASMSSIITSIVAHTIEETISCSDLMEKKEKTIMILKGKRKGLPSERKRKKEEEEDPENNNINEQHDDDTTDPLALRPIFDRVICAYLSKCRIMTILSCFGVIPMIYAKIVFQASLEKLTSDPIVLFDLTIFSIPLNIAIFVWKLYQDLKPYLLVEFGGGSVGGSLSLGFYLHLLAVPWIVLLARGLMFRVAMNYYYNNNGESKRAGLGTLHNETTTTTNTADGTKPAATSSIITSQKRIRRRRPTTLTSNNPWSLLGANIILSVGGFLSMTIVPVLLGPYPLEMGWILNWGRIPTALGILSLLFLWIRGVGPLLLVYPALLKEKLTLFQGFRRSRELTARHEARFEVWFSHLIVIFVQVLVSHFLRSLWPSSLSLSFFTAIGSDASTDQLWGQLFLQNLASLVFLPLIIILQTDLYVQLRLFEKQSSKQSAGTSSLVNPQHQHHHNQKRPLPV